MAEVGEEIGKEAKKGLHSFWLHSAGSLPKPLGVLNPGISLSDPWVTSKASKAKPTPSPTLYLLLVCCAVLSRSVMSNSLQPMDCSLPGFSVHRDSPGKIIGVGCHALLQGIFPTQGSNSGLPHGRRILYCLSHQGSPYWYVLPHKAFIESSR